MKQNISIILASGSPRRSELLRQAGLKFTVFTTDADESTDITDPEKTVEELSRRKAEAAAAALGSDIDKKEVLIVSADTVVVMDGNIIGKPVDERDALQILMSLSGRTHYVYTGVSCIDTRENVTESFVEKTAVTMYSFDENEALDYIKTGEPMDKAGAYGIQGIGARLVEKIEGDYNNVVGFPLASFIRRGYGRFFFAE